MGHIPMPGCQSHKLVWLTARFFPTFAWCQCVNRRFFQTHITPVLIYSKVRVGGIRLETTETAALTTWVT